MASFLHILNRPNFAVPVFKYLTQTFGRPKAVQIYHSYKCAGIGVFKKVLDSDPNFRAWLEDNDTEYLDCFEEWWEQYI